VLVHRREGCVRDRPHDAKVRAVGHGVAKSTVRTRQ
jgi:hypothetical protein